MSKILGENIARLRRLHMLTQEDLAKETGLSAHSINSYESGRREPNSKAMATLEEYFGVTGKYLRGESGIVIESEKSCEDCMDYCGECYKPLKEAEKKRMQDAYKRELAMFLKDELIYAIVHSHYTVSEITRVLYRRRLDFNYQKISELLEENRELNEKMHSGEMNAVEYLTLTEKFQSNDKLIEKLDLENRRCEEKLYGKKGR